MSKIKVGSGARVQLLAATTSTGTGTRYTFDRPVSQFGLQVVAGSTNASVLLQGAIASSSDATLTTLGTFARSSDASGNTLFFTGKPVTQLAATLDAGASSAGASAWVALLP